MSDLERLPPTLLTRMSTGPRASTACSCSPWMLDSSETSPTTPTDATPRPLISSTAASRVSEVRPQIPTSTPSLARDRAACLPSPLLPPVTRATFPLIPRSISSPHLTAGASSGNAPVGPNPNACWARRHSNPTTLCAPGPPGHLSQPSPPFLGS